MNPQAKILTIAGTALLLAAIPAFVFLSASKTPDSAPRAAIRSVTPTPIKVQTSDAQVTITAAGFFPATVSIEAGRQVIWHNTDSAPHQPSANPHPKDDGYPGFACPEPLGSDDSFGFTFEKPGEYTYHDHLNPLSFRGTVLVK